MKITRWLMSKKSEDQILTGPRGIFRAMMALLVELVGFEPTSKHIPHKLSTCLSLN